MKTILSLSLIGLTFFLKSTLHAQTSNLPASRSVIYDALYISSHLDFVRGNFQFEGDTSKAILRDYFSNPDFITALHANPFINQFIPGGYSASFGGATIDNLISSAGNLNVTNIADGLTKFLIERAKEELSIAFFDQMKKDLADEKYEDLRLIFPQTYRTLQLIDQRIYQFSAYLTSLREVFILDLNGLPNTLPLVIHKPVYYNYFQQNPALKMAIQLGIISSNFLINKGQIRHVGVVIDSLLKPDLLFPISQPANPLHNTQADINGSIKTLQLISQSLRSTDTAGQGTPAAKYWVSLDSVQLLFSSPNTLKIYLGLLYQQAQNTKIRFANDRQLTQMLDTIAAKNEISKVTGILYSLYAGFKQYEDYRIQFNNIKQGLQKDSLSIIVNGLITGSIDIIENGMELLNEWLPDSTNKTLQTFVPIARSMSEIYLYIPQKRYGLAVLSAANLYRQIFEFAHNGGLANSSTFEKISRKLSLYGTFMAEVSNAENSDQVKEIIKRTALPAGSSYVKKHSRFNVALNAYLGGFWGNEFLAEKGKQHWASAAGVYAPVGINFSKGILGKRGKSFGSASILLNIIDIGTFASFRLKDQTTSALPEVKLKNIFAPGIGLVYGLPKYPISLGYTYQLGPNLREINPDVVITSEKMNRRWQFFLGVDIPLLNFYNKPK